MKTTFPEDKEILFAYHSIHDFFDVYIVSDALQYLQDILKIAAGKKIWKSSCPYSVLHYIVQLDKLSTAAFIIHNNFGQREQAIMNGSQKDPDFTTLLQASIGSKRGDNLWSCFPRSLTLKQFYDPYKSLRKFCEFMSEQNWKKAFSELQEYALSKRDISELYPPHNMIKLQLRLSQLIEACHLLEVRTHK
ncbi:MAG TPA: hypothetical protein VK484_00170 [Ferruginibacter sp.]|nr:hypothetical protein [Ferruginibacter sp.]